ncbi:glycosyltransferase [Neptuniibacter marinus]|uniref:glycosyltransferase n=1 Tax=Neptuniibacter marinus TaxID=1806670 RepID=UPI003B5BB49E
MNRRLDSNKVHVLILPSWYPQNSRDVSGVFFRDQALALSNYGHKVGVVAPELKSFRTLAGKLKSNASPIFELDENVPTYRKSSYAYFPKLPYGNYWLFKRLAKKLINKYIVEQGCPEIIHAHSAIFAGAVAAELSDELQIPFVITEHSTGFARKLYAPWQMKLAKRAFTQASTCIAVSPELGKLLDNQIASVGVQWTWVPNVVAERFQTTVVHNKKNKPVRFLNLALMTEKKGQLDLLRAFKLGVEQGLQAELWFGGDGVMRSTLEQSVLDLGVSKHVRFLGMVEPDNVPKLLEEVDVLVVPSHYETFGVVAAEALMVGVPVIATRCGGPECIVTEKDGILVAVKKPQELSLAMIRLSQNINAYNSARISKFAKERFSGKAVAEQLTKVYQEVLSDHINN